MDDDEQIDNQIIKAMSAYLESVERAVDCVQDLLYGAVPAWIPEPSIERAKRTIKKLVNVGFSPCDINQRVAETENDDLIIPGIITDPSVFEQSIYELAHFRYAITLGKSKGLGILSGEQAVHGQKFKDGRKLGTCGQVRKAVAKLLAKNPSMKNFELWNAIKGNPPKGWRTYENYRLGKYLEGPNTENIGYRCFCTVCGQERKKKRGKITS